MGRCLPEEISQNIGKSGESRAVVTLRAAFPDAALGNFSQLQDGFGAADVAVEELCIHALVNPWNLFKLKKVTSRSDSIPRRMRYVSIAFAAVLLTITPRDTFLYFSNKKL